MRTRRTTPNNAGIDPHNIIATTFLRHYENTEIPEELLKNLTRSITHRTLIHNAPDNTLIPSYEIETQLKNNYDYLDPQFLAHIIHTTLGWKYNPTILDATTRTITNDDTTWLDNRIGERLPPGTTYIAYKHRIHKYTYSGFFITPDTTPTGQPTLLTMHVGKYPISLNIPLGQPKDEAINKVLRPYRNTWPRQNTRDKNTLSNIISIIKTLTGAPNATHEINGLDIRTRAENITNLITHVQESHQRLHHRLNELRRRHKPPTGIPTPTQLIHKAVNPNDPHATTTAHLIAAIHALNNGGQVIIHEKPLSELPNQLTTMHKLPEELVTRAQAPATYICANITCTNTINGVIARPDINEHGHPQLIITFHSMGFPSVIIPVGVRVWEAIKTVPEQLQHQDAQGLPGDNLELNKYVIAILTALQRTIEPHNHPAHSSTQEKPVTYSTA